jgi:hypothetical protein
MVTPYVVTILEVSSTDQAGLLAGVGYSAVVIPLIGVDIPASFPISLAN